jgi:hypothetical protein
MRNDAMRRAGTFFFELASLLVLSSLTATAQTTKPRRDTILRNQPPTASLAASATTITLACADARLSLSGACPSNPNRSVQLSTKASDPEHDALSYLYKVNGGRITGQGANVNWDLSDVGPGTYTVSVDVNDGFGGITTAVTMVTIKNCPDCVEIDNCPALSASCPDVVDVGQPITFTVSGYGQAKPAATGFNWTVSAGTITSGQGTPSITVRTQGLGGQNVTASLEVIGLDPSCPRIVSCTTSVNPPIIEREHFDEYGNIRFNDEKARLDNFAFQLENLPTFTGYIVAYGTCDDEGRERGNRARRYLTDTRRINAERVVVVDGGCLPELMVVLYAIPRGEKPPSADALGLISPCPVCRKPPVNRRPRREKS